MTLEAATSDWLYRFTYGGIPLPVSPPDPSQDPKQAKAKALADQLQLAQAREWSQEQALKQALLAKAFKVVEAAKEEMRKAFDLQVTTREDDGSEQVQDVRDEKGRQERAFDTAEAPKAISVTGKTDKSLTATDATKAMSILVGESDELGAVMVDRSYADEKTGTIKTKPAKLFTDDEIMDELYTPLVRDLVLPETFVPDKFSATQKMIDSTNDYYIKDCKAKGKPMGFGGADLAKAGIQVGATIATTILGAQAPVAQGQEALATSGNMTKTDVAHWTDITNGIAAGLTAIVDVVDQVDDFRNSGDFSQPGFDKVIGSLANTIGFSVAGATGDKSLGTLISASIMGAKEIGDMGITIANWRKTGGDFPWDATIGSIGNIITASITAASSKEKDRETKDREGEAAAIIGGTFATIAAGAKGKVIQSAMKGDWTGVFTVIATAADNTAKAVPVAVVWTPSIDAQADEAKKQGLMKAVADMSSAIDSTGKAVNTLTLDGLTTALNKLGIEAPKTERAHNQDEIDALYEEKQKEVEAKAAEAEKAEVANIQKSLDKERQDYKDSLKCLGSDSPTEAEYKSIAKLIAQLEHDKLIFDGLMAMFGGASALGSATGAALSVAAEVAAPLKMAGQLIKYIGNLKAAADRLSAWLDWREGQKDAESAVSHYATAIDNFAKNQGSQFTHYTVQAVANAIQMLLAAGEMSPYAPAFKIAGASVALAAAVEDAVYKFYKAMELRTAWKLTKESIDPKNKGNRKMALLARAINPTLAKYTIAYGALIAEDPIAITAMNRVGLDRETLTRAGDKVADVKKYLETLYVDDGVVLGTMDAAPSKTKVPDPALTTRAWSVSHLLWSEKEGLVTANPTIIMANLVMADTLERKTRKKLEEEELDDLDAALKKLQQGFLSFDPQTDAGTPVKSAKDTALAYAELAENSLTLLRMERAAGVYRKQEEPVS